MPRKIILILTLASYLTCCTPPTDNEKEKEKVLKKNWEYEYYMAYGVNCPPTVFDDSLVVMTGDINLSCFRISDGSIKWKTQIDNEIALDAKILLNYNSDYIIGTHVNGVYAWDIKNGKETWFYELPEDRRSLSVFTGSIGGSILYLPGTENNKAINIFGEMKYSVTRSVPSNYNVGGKSTSAIINKDKLYCNSSWGIYTSSGVKYYGRIICLNSETGDSLWAFNSVRGGFYMSPTIEDNVIYCGTHGGYGDFYAIDAETGKQIWKYEELSGYHAIIIDNIIYVNDGGSVVALNKSDGSKIWRADINALNTHPMAYYNGYIYYTDVALYIVDTQTGKVVKKIYSEDSTSFWYVSTGGGKLFLQSANHLYCYEPWKKDS